MSSAEVEIDVSYGQLAVFNEHVENPFNDWTDAHVAQGFAWREGSASFRTLQESGLHRVAVAVEPVRPLAPSNAVRIIEVPFLVTSEESVEVSGIVSSAAFHIPAGRYQLFVEMSSGGNTYEGDVKLVFVPGGPRAFKVLLADAELNPPDELVTEALPAQ